MSQQTQQMMKGKPNPKNNGPSSGKPNQKPLSMQEQKNLATLRTEAKKAGSFLATGGKGGLSPTLVLQVMKRDRFLCKACGRKGTEDNGITVHHAGGVISSQAASNAGHESKPSNVVTLCENCHDKIHVKAKKMGIDSSQVTPAGDKGTKRDHGLPLAKPPSGKQMLKAEQGGINAIQKPGAARIPVRK